MPTIIGENWEKSFQDINCQSQVFTLASVAKNDKGNLTATLIGKDGTQFWVSVKTVVARFGGSYNETTKELSYEIGATSTFAIKAGKIVSMVGEAIELTATQKAEVLRLTAMGVAPATAMIEARKIA